MFSLLRRAATAAGLAASAFSTSSQAQDTLALPERPTLRRALPVATTPVVQQSPNGLYKLSITDAGIELRGPKGVVKITDAGIVIGEPTTTRVEIHAGNMSVRVGQEVRLDAGMNTIIRSGSNLEMRSGANLDIRSGANLDLRGASVHMTNGASTVKLDAAASLLGQRVHLGCLPGKPAARVGDVVNTSVSPAVVVQGAPTVLVC